MCSRGTASLAGSGPSLLASSNADFFFQGGRKICVGDCALFKPPSESPPFVGIIRSVNAGKENNLKLGVNWLYRHSDVKLGKGILLEAVPNEIFYSFHKDEIPAASLLHPCKVAFLPQSVELPSGISSFVCRRVYDITNKCLWWLTDQDYSDQHQEEVNLLLYKTRVELLETVQPGVFSSKSMNGPTSSSLLKSGSDNVSNAASFPAQVKGKKRDRGDQGFEPVKRALKNDDGDSAQSLKSEIAKITDRGGLVDSEAVGKLVELMQADKKIDLVNRSTLAGVIAATDKFDCLSQFVQLQGLRVFDDWLQEVHKGKIYDSTVQRDGDKPVEEFLLVLLRSLDKLPVNINALQMCNIGKSVNHLRTHKNVEIQKKARSLVDTWKKRVEAEMNIIDSKSGSNQAVHWPSRPRVHEVSQGANRHPGGSDVTAKSLNAQLSASKPSAVRPALGESNGKSGPVSPGSTKPGSSPFSVGNNLKDVQSQSPVGGSSDFPVSASRDEKSSSSSPSHNSHSCSSDHIRTVASSGKEDARSSTAGSVNVNRISGGMLRSRKTTGGLPGAQKETGLNRIPSCHKSMSSYEKNSQSGLFCDKAIDMPVAEGNSHKLIVKIPHCSPSPSQTTNGSAFGEPSLMSSRSSSPVQPEKQEHCDGNFEEKNHTCQTTVTTDVNIESGRSNKFKDSLNGFHEGEGSPMVLGEEICQNSNGSRRITEVSKAVPVSLDSDSKAGKVLEASYSLNRFIESCVKYSEASSSMSFADDGMNLLASVAAGEMSTSDLTAKADSPGKVTTLDNSCAAGTLISGDGKGHLLNSKQCNDCMDENTEKHISTEGTSLACTRDKVAEPSVSEEKPIEQNKFSASLMDVPQRGDISVETSEQLVNARAPTLEAASAEAREKVEDARAGKQLQESEVRLTSSALGDSALVNGENVGKETAEALTLFQAASVDYDKNKVDGKHWTSASTIHSQLAKETSVTSPPDICVDSKVAIEKGSAESDEMKFAKADTAEMMNIVTHPVMQRIKVESKVLTAVSFGKLASAAIDQKDITVVKTETKVGLECHTGGSTPKNTSTRLAAKDEAEESQSETLDAVSAAVGSDLDSKVKFDLNEGFSADEGKYEEPSNLTISSCSAAVHIISPVPLAASSLASNLPTSITVAAAAKGPFVPPNDLLRSKGEHGWKGSAATSAFRRAEPRKVSEIQSNTNNAPLASVFSSKSRSFLDIDLNVADERVVEETAAQNGTGGLPESHLRMAHNEMGSTGVRSSYKLDLDLNRVDEATDMGVYPTNNDHRLDVPLFPAKLSASGSIPNDERNLRRGFDLNDGPILDEIGTDVSPFTQQAWNSIPSQPTVASVRPNNTEMGKFSSWFPSGNTVPIVTIPSVLPDRVEQHFPIAAGGPQRIFAGATPLGSNIFRAPVLPSSPAAPFPSASFQYPVFHFGTNFPTSSATVSGGTTFMDASSGGKLSFSAGHSHLLGTASTVSSSYPRPYIISLSDGNTNAGVESNSRWGRQGLDLNAGPGSETDGREKTTAFAVRQPSVVGSQSLTEEQARMYQATGVVLKRKDPEGGWDADKYKQHTWQ